jgi:regulator of sirC expression with transglutaminase-like and TPR domain
MEQRDRGILYYHTGRWTEARADLSSYLAAEPLAQDAPVIQKLVDQMEASQDE